MFDQQGAIVTGVKVKLTGDSVVQPRSTVSNAAGAYRFGRLASGTYRLTFSHKNFVQATLDVELKPGKIVRSNPTLVPRAPAVRVCSPCPPITFPREKTTDSSPSIAIRISAAPHVVRPGAEVRVRVLITNISGHEVSLGRSNGQAQGEHTNRIEVFAGDGAPAPLTAYGRALQDPERHSFSNIWFSLQPGASFEDEIIVSKIFNLTRPGKCTIQVQRPDPTSALKPAIQSNVVKIRVKR